VSGQLIVAGIFERSIWIELEEDVLHGRPRGERVGGAAEVDVDLTIGELGCQLLTDVKGEGGLADAALPARMAEATPVVLLPAANAANSCWTSVFRPMKVF
jgi:hypothetical protein